MSLPSAPVRRPWSFASLALVSVLHTSAAAHAQTRSAAPEVAAPPSSGPSAPPANGVAPDTANVREQARAAYGAGQDAYGAGQYAEAAEHFARADSFLPALQAKYWRAMSLDQLGDVAGALAAFELLLAQPDKGQLGPEKLATAEARRQALATTPAHLTVTTTPSGARLNVSGVDLATPTPFSLRLAPGRHLVRVSLEGYEPQQVEITATAGAKLSPHLTLVPSVVPAAGAALSAPPDIAFLPASTPAERSRVPGYVTLGIAGASAVVGTIFGVMALGDKQDFEDRPTTSKADDVERNALIADMAFGVALTLGITGIVLLVADDPGPEQASSAAPAEARLRLLPYVAPHGAGAAATLSF